MTAKKKQQSEEQPELPKAEKKKEAPQGVALRDFFAAAAMQGLSSGLYLASSDAGAPAFKQELDGITRAAFKAYEIADHMIKVRNLTNE